jgi:putative endopeptidase
MEETYARMQDLSETAAKNIGKPGSNQQKIGDFYASGLAAETDAKQGLAALQIELDQISAVKNTTDLVKVVARLQKLGVGALFSINVGQDEKESEHYLVHLGQGGLDLPSRDYYVNTDERNKNIRLEFQKYLTTMFQLLGEDTTSAARDTHVTLALETQLSQASRKLEDLRDPETNYKKMTLIDFARESKALDWVELLNALNVGSEKDVIIGQPEFFAALDKVLTSTSLEDVKTYMRSLLVNSYAEFLPPPYDRAHFSFYGVILNGQKEQRPRVKRVLDSQEMFLGDALGQLYVERYYSPATKKRYVALTENIISAYKERIEKVEWLNLETKKLALAKLAKVRRKVGYPEKWRDYSSMNISRTSYFENAMQGNLWMYQYYAAKLGKPVDHSEWNMTPQTYNAYYDPSNNEIVLPAAIFIIPGLNDDQADDALVYGYAGASTIGHEITHGFDDQGRQFDANGNLSNWWKPEDIAAFNKATQLYIDQFNNYVVLKDLHVNGKATLGENIADLGGLVNGLEAFKKTAQYKKGELIGGYTPIQRFFLGYALSWMLQMRDEALAKQILTDVHAPAFLRVNGPLSNIPEFYEAFGVKAGDEMYRPENIRVKIW